MTTATYIMKDVHPDGAIVFWFVLEGHDHNSGMIFGGIEFDDKFGIKECGVVATVVDCDGVPVDYSDRLARTVSRLCTVTDEMRAA